MRLKKSAFTAILTLLTVITVWLLVQFAAPVLNLQLSLYQGRWLLLAWRLALYGLAVWQWVILSPRLQQHNPAAFRHLKRAADWSLVLLATGEISNLLQWGETV